MKTENKAAGFVTKDSQTDRGDFPGGPVVKTILARAQVRWLAQELKYHIPRGS